jgi:hypothetical protein
MNAHYRNALLCGAIPLVAGVTIFLGWVVTRHQAWPVAGAWMLLIGAIAVISGGASLWKFRRAHPSDEAKFMWALGLLASNFVTAGGILYLYEDDQTTYFVNVVNESGRPVESLTISAPGVHQELGPIPPNVTARYQCRPDNEGTLHFTMTQGGVITKGMIDYVTHPGGGRYTLTIKPDGTVDIAW